MSEEHLPTVPEAVTRASKEIMALHTGNELKPVIPQTLEEAFRFAQLVCQAGLAPKSYEYDEGPKKGQPDPQKVVVGILTALELGVPPLQGLSGIAIINGRPSVWGDLAVGLVQSRGLIETHEVTETGTFPNDDYTVTVKFWRRGQSNPYEGKFSVKDAKTAGLWGNPRKLPWVNYPKRMVYNRARAFPLRDGFADALKGLSIAEEIMDLPIPSKEPVNPSFLTDDSPALLPSPAEPAEAPSTPEAISSRPTAESPPETATAPEIEPEKLSDDDMAEFGAYLAMLPDLETIVRLSELRKEVEAWIAERPEREALRGQWSTAKLSRERELAAKKTK